MSARRQRAIILGDDHEPSQPADVRLTRLAAQIRTLYVICVREFTHNMDYGKDPIPRWDGGYDAATGRTYESSTWLKIAETVLQCGAEPFQFIRAQFYNGRRATTIRPNQIHGEEAIARWTHFREQSRQEVKQRIESDLNQIQVHVLPFTVNLKWEYTRALNYVLRDPSCCVSALVRYCQATAASLPVAAAFYERALVQYMFQSADYDEFIGPQIPEQLRNDAATLRGELIGR